MDDALFTPTRRIVMSAKVNMTAIALVTVLAAPAAAVARDLYFPSWQRQTEVPLTTVKDPYSRIIGADSDAAVGFEMRRDWSRGR
jgi:hypothetical protein